MIYKADAHTKLSTRSTAQSNGRPTISASPNGCCNVQININFHVLLERNIFRCGRPQSNFLLAAHTMRFSFELQFLLSLPRASRIRLSQYFSLCVASCTAVYVCSVFASFLRTPWIYFRILFRFSSWPWETALLGPILYLVVSATFDYACFVLSLSLLSSPIC